MWGLKELDTTEILSMHSNEPSKTTCILQTISDTATTTTTYSKTRSPQTRSLLSPILHGTIPQFKEQTYLTVQTDLNVVSTVPHGVHAFV